MTTQVIEHKKLLHAGPCITRNIKLVGGDGYHDLMYIQLIQKYGISEDIAKHLCRTYGAPPAPFCERDARLGCAPCERCASAGLFRSGTADLVCHREFP